MRAISRFWKAGLAAVVALVLVSGTASAAPQLNPAERQALIQRLQQLTAQQQQLNNELSQLQRQKASVQRDQRIRFIQQIIAGTTRESLGISNRLRDLRR